MCGHTNVDDDSGSQFFLQHSGIRNCKPGIWTSIATDAPDDEGMMECILRWVAPGSIDLSQPVEDWEKYEKETRKIDAEAWGGWKVRNGWDGKAKSVNWRKEGSYYDDGGLCNVISAEYLTREACEKMMAGQEVKYDYYVETLTLSAMDGEAQNSCFCIGGMSCKFCLSLYGFGW